MIVKGYCGGGWASHVTVDGEHLDPGPSQRVWNHSPDGFSWGYAGSGPAQLALAILLAAGIPEANAVRLHQDFKFEVVAGLPQNEGFEIEIDVPVWAGNRLIERGLA